MLVIILMTSFVVVDVAPHVQPQVIVEHIKGPDIIKQILIDNSTDGRKRKDDVYCNMC